MSRTLRNQGITPTASKHASEISFLVITLPLVACHQAKQTIEHPCIDIRNIWSILFEDFCACWEAAQAVLATSGEEKARSRRRDARRLKQETNISTGTTVRTLHILCSVSGRSHDATWELFVTFVFPFLC